MNVIQRPGLDSAGHAFRQPSRSGSQIFIVQASAAAGSWGHAAWHWAERCSHALTQDGTRPAVSTLRVAQQPLRTIASQSKERGIHHAREE
jgi:hypothetical protein